MPEKKRKTKSEIKWERSRDDGREGKNELRREGGKGEKTRE